MMTATSTARQRYFSSRGVIRRSVLMLLILGLAIFAGLAFGEAVPNAFRAMPGVDWLLLVAGSNDAILHDANMIKQAQFVSAFRLIALTALPLPMLLSYLALLRAEPKPPAAEAAKLLWYVPVAILALWYGLFFDNVFLLHYDEWYSPLALVPIATMAGAFLLPLLAAVATHLVRSSRQDQMSKSP